MGLISWDARLQTGHGKIDSQHKELLDAINRLHTAMKQGKGKSELGSILTFLKDYTVSHFQMEEELMNTHRYPGSPKHKAIHHDLVVQVEDLVAKHEKGENILTLSVMDFLEDWLVQHIQGEDFRFAAYLKEKGVAA